MSYVIYILFTVQETDGPDNTQSVENMRKDNDEKTNVPWTTFLVCPTINVH